MPCRPSPQSTLSERAGWLYLCSVSVPPSKKAHHTICTPSGLKGVFVTRGVFPSKRSNMSLAQSTGFPIPSTAKDESLPARARARAVIDLIVAYGLILATIWTPRPQQQWFYMAATAWVILSTWRSFPGWNALGFRASGFWQSAWVIGAAGLFAVATVTAAIRLHTLRGPLAGRGWIMTFGGYVVWSFAQQFLLQSYFLYRFRRLISNEKLAVVAAAGIFAAAHLPNPIL